VLWCVDWGTPVLTSVVFWTSARPACKRCAAPPATSVISSAVDTHVIVLALHERSLRRCSVPAAACGWCRMERRGAQRCSSGSWIESDCMQASVRDPQSVDAECGGSPVHGSCMITPRLRRVCRTSNAGLEGLRVLSCYRLQDVVVWFTCKVKHKFVG